MPDVFLTPLRVAVLLLALPMTRTATAQTTQGRPRARDVGVVIGVFKPGPLNAITDVAGVRVGQTTLHLGDTVNTGVTAVVPHEGDLFHDRVPAAAFVMNGFGKLIGTTQLAENGELETPILLTCTLCVWKAADAMVDYLLQRPGMENVRSINPVVGETNDGDLSDIRARPISAQDVRAALTSARGGPVDEGSVGAGSGTRALGWKGGIGTSSRRLPAAYGPYTVGVLVQTNFGGILTVNGAPVGRELGRYDFRQAVEDSAGHGSCMIIVATDAPLSVPDLARLAKRAALGLARTGSYAGPTSGDYVIAFSTATDARRPYAPSASPPVPYTTRQLAHDDLAPLFEATVEATEEAVINSLFRATPVTYRGRTTDALPIDRTVAALRKYRAIP